LTKSSEQRFPTNYKPIEKSRKLHIKTEYQVDVSAITATVTEEGILDQMYRNREATLVSANYCDLLAGTRLSGLKNHEADGDQENVLLRRNHWRIKPWADLNKLGYEVDNINLGEGYAKCVGRINNLDWITVEEYSKITDQEEREQYKYFPNIWTMEIRCHPHNRYFCHLDKEAIRPFARTTAQILNGEVRTFSLETLKYLADAVEFVTGLPFRNLRVYDDVYCLDNPAAQRNVTFTPMDYNMEYPEINIHATMLSADLLYLGGTRKLQYYVPTRDDGVLPYKLYNVTKTGFEIAEDRSGDPKIKKYFAQLEEAKARSQKKGFFSRMLGFSGGR
jgi:hypothetical protein